MLTTVNQPSSRKPIQVQGQDDHRQHYAQEQQGSRPSPGWTRFSSLSSSSQKHQTKSSGGFSPLVQRKDVLIDIPSVSLEELLSPPLSPLPRANNNAVSPRTSRRVPPLKRIESVESVESLSDLPETVEDYDALDYKTKMRLGDEIKVKNKIRSGRERDRSSTSRQRDRHHGDKENRQHTEESRKKKGENEKKEKEEMKQSERPKKHQDNFNVKEKEKDKDKDKDKGKGKEKEKERDQDRPIYQVRHADLQQDYSATDSDFDLDDADPFKAKPLGVVKGGSSTKTKEVQAMSSILPSAATSRGNAPSDRSAIVIVDKDDTSSSEKDSGADQRAFTTSKSRDSNDDHHATDKKSKFKKAATVRKSEPWRFTDEEQQQYGDLIIHRPILTHTTDKAMGSERPATLREGFTAGMKVIVSQEKDKQKVENRRVTDFFSLRRRQPTLEVSRGRSKSSAERSRSSSPDPRWKRNQRPELSVRSKSSSNFKRFNKTNQSSSSIHDTESPVRSSQSDIDSESNNVCNVLTIPNLSDDVDSARSFSNKRSKSFSSDLSSDEDVLLDDISAVSSFGSFPSTPTKKTSINEPGSDNLLETPQRRTPGSGPRFQLPSPSKKRPRMTTPSDYLLSDDDISGI
ncbi:hypothetical protein BGZ65_008312, partial [Modicella reniformis]